MLFFVLCWAEFSFHSFEDYIKWHKAIIITIISSTCDDKRLRYWGNPTHKIKRNGVEHLWTMDTHTFQFGSFNSIYFSLRLLLRTAKYTSFIINQLLSKVRTTGPKNTTTPKWYEEEEEEKRKRMFIVKKSFHAVPTIYLVNEMCQCFDAFLWIVPSVALPLLMLWTWTMRHAQFSHLIYIEMKKVESRTNGTSSTTANTPIQYKKRIRTVSTFESQSLAERNPTLSFAKHKKINEHVNISWTQRRMRQMWKRERESK